MSIMWKQNLQVVLLLAVFGKLVWADCSFQSEIGLEPTVWRNFGLQKILAAKSNQINIEVDETIDIYCATGLSIHRNYYGGTEIKATSLTLKCRSNNYLVYSTSETNGYNEVNDLRYINCNGPSGIQLYESKHEMTNCESFTSLGLGVKVTNFTSVIYAGICYDWITLDLKYINYQAYMDPNIVLPKNQKELELIENQQLDDYSVSLDEKLQKYNTFFNFISELQFNVYYQALQSKNQLLENFEFNYVSLVQDSPLTRELTAFENILSTIWWRNLRLGNWRTFLRLLQERSVVQKYNVYLGTSGVIEIPKSIPGCNTNETFVLVTEEGIRHSAPAFIWTYLNAIHPSDTEEVVVIGYNSPFYNIDDSVSICESMCDEIPWLRQMEKVRRMPTLGLVYCCHPSEVADKLDNFPFKNAQKSVKDEPAATESAELSEPTIADLILNYTV